MNIVALLCAVAAVMIATWPRRPSRRLLGPDATSDGALALRATRLGELTIRWQRRRAERRPPSARAVAAWCDDLSRRLRSGSTLRDAVTSTVAADPSTEFALRRIRLTVERGASLADAIDLRDDRSAGQHLRLALSVIRTAARVGGPSSAAIDRTAMTLRRRAAEADDRATHAAQARLSVWVMTALPLLLLAVLAITDRDVRAVAVAPVGAACIGAGLVLNLSGWWWMRRIVGALR